MSRAIIWRKEEENEKYFSNQIKLLTESISAAFSQESPRFIPRLCDAVLWSWLPDHTVQGEEPPTPSCPSRSHRSGPQSTDCYAKESTVSRWHLWTTHSVPGAAREQTHKGDTTRVEGGETDRPGEDLKRDCQPPSPGLSKQGDPGPLPGQL